MDSNRSNSGSGVSLSHDLVKTVVWPVSLSVVAIVAMLIYHDTNTLSGIELGPKGLKIAFNLLEAAERGGASGIPASRAPDLEEIKKIADRTSKISLSGAKVLWVDDNPQNQKYERGALEVLGIEFVVVGSTAEALQMIYDGNIKVVITDFKREGDPEAGYTLLQEIKKINGDLPVIIYSSSVTPKLEKEAKGRGAYGETNNAQILFGMTVDAILRR